MSPVLEVSFQKQNLVKEWPSSSEEVIILIWWLAWNTHNEFQVKTYKGETYMSPAVVFLLHTKGLQNKILLNIVPKSYRDYSDHTNSSKTST